MITRFLTDVHLAFNPFVATAKTARSFFAFISPEARASGLKVTTKVLPRNTVDKPILDVTFKDGKKINFDLDAVKIKDVISEVNRHSRILARQEELSGN